MRGLIGGLAALALLAMPAAAENCLTNVNTNSTSNVASTAGTFFQIGGSDVVRAANPPGLTNAQAVTVNGSGSAPTAIGALSCGAGSQASGVNSVAVGQDAKASAVNSVAIGHGAQATATNAVAIGSNAIASQPNTVSVGSPSSPNRVTNVAAGVLPTDAANVSQLTTATSNLQNQINASRKEYRAGISMAMAAAALQTGAGAAGPGKVAIGMAGGEFGGTASLSAGIAYSPVKNLNFNAGVSVAPIVGMVGVFGGTVWTLN